jgi:DNA repair protein RecO (recombination protein O)
LLKKEKVIILRMIKHGDSDLILHALNRQGARMGFFARGGAKSRKRFGGGVLEPTHYVEVSYRERKSADGEPLHTLMEAQLIQGFEKLRTGYDRLQAALYFLKISGKLAQEGTVDSHESFDLLGNALKAAETTNQIDRLKLHFEIKVLAQQGVLPPFPIAESWTHHPLKEHESLALDKIDLRQLEWDIHHSLESYLSGSNEAW